MSERTAQAYMRVARSHRNLGAVKAQRVADLSFRVALKRLSETRPVKSDQAEAARRPFAEADRRS